MNFITVMNLLKNNNINNNTTNNEQTKKSKEVFDSLEEDWGDVNQQYRKNVYAKVNKQ